MDEWLKYLIRETRVVELRHPEENGRWSSGLFDDVGALMVTINSFRGRGNLYTTINRVGASVRATNCMGSRAVRDGDIQTHTFLPFDFDPTRPKNCPSTDEELAAAVALRNRTASVLAGVGWPEAAVAMSGNGTHLLYRSNLPADGATAEMLAWLYRGMRADFSTDAVTFDPTVRNPSRILRLYGSLNCKGEATDQRPHRMSSIALPARWTVVSPKVVERLADAYARRSTSAAKPMRMQPSSGVPLGWGNYSTLNVVAWFRAHGLYRRFIGPDKHAVCCPWVCEHSSEPSDGDTSTVIWEGRREKWPTFHCSHAHCEGRTFRDVMERLGDADSFCTSEW